MNYLMVVAGVILLFWFLKLLTRSSGRDRKLVQKIDKTAKKKPKKAGEKDSEDEDEKEKTGFAMAWEKSKGPLKSFLFLIPYFTIAFIFYKLVPKAWEPWPENILLFFILLPAAILFPVLVKAELEEKKRALPMSFAYLVLFILGAVTVNVYRESSWWQEHKAEEARVKEVAAAKVVASNIYWFKWRKPEGVRGSDPQVRVGKPVKARVKFADGFFEMTVFYEQNYEPEQAQYIGRVDHMGMIKGTFTQKSPANRGTFELEQNSDGHFSGLAKDESCKPGEFFILTLDRIQSK